MTYQPGPYPSPYPSPYQYPPGYGYDPMQALLAPARRAGMMMIVMGSLMLVLGVCGGLGYLAGDDAMMRQQLEAFGMDLGPEPDQMVQSLRFQSMIGAIRMTVLGLPMLVVGVFVRGGRRGPVIGGIVLTGLQLLLVGIDIVVAVVQSTRNPMLLGGVCVSIVPLALFTLQLVWLIQASRAGATAQAMQVQYQQQYWQYAQQQQQMYAQQQQMYGQGQPPQAANPNVPAPMTNQIPSPNDQTRPGGGSDGTGTQG